VRRVCLQISLDDPNSVVIDENQNMIVSDSHNHRILMIDRNDVLIKQIGSKGNEDGQFNFPKGVAINHNNQNIFVSDHYNNRIQVFDENLNFLRLFPTQSKNEVKSTPNGISIDEENGDIISDSSSNIFSISSHQIQRYDERGTLLNEFGSQGRGDGQFYYPSGVTINQKNRNIIVADTWNYRIEVFDCEGKFLMQFGSKGNGDLNFNYPNSVMMTQQGMIAVSDTNNHCEDV
jgi:DNA-binding beta-propeller fold protein YncE